MNASKAMLFIAAVCLSIAILHSTATTQSPAPPRRTIFSPLAVGQPIVLKERGSLCEIGTLDEAGPLTHKIVEIGNDYIVVRDNADVVESRIPATALRAVTMTRLKRN